MNGRLHAPWKLCPECGGDGGYPLDADRPIKVSFDYGRGETFKSNWKECEACEGLGEIRVEEDEDV